MTAAVLLALLLGTLYFATSSMERAWRLIGVPSYHNTFGDLRVITNSLPCVAAGVDPYVKNACNDFWKNNPQAGAPYQDLLLNYPPVWLNISHLGASPQTTSIFGVIIGALAFMALLRIFRPKTPIGGAITIAALLSPSVLLGFERGNIDLVIFSCLTFLIVFTENLPARFKAIGRCMGLIALTILKFFPVVCVTVLVRSRRSWVLAFGTGLVAIAATWLCADGRFAAVLSNTPKVDNLAFGSLPLFIGIQKALTGSGHVSKGMSLAAFLLSAIAFLTLFVPMLLGKRKSPFPQYLHPLTDDVNGNLALAGLSIFCVGFLFGASFDYRLIFLTLPLPLLIAAYENDVGRSVKRLVAPLAIVLFFWLSRATDKIFYADEILDWIIFAVGSAWVASRLFLQSPATRS